MNDDEKNYYEILKVPQKATDVEINRAYRKLALKYHPDKNRHPDATEIFRGVKNAFDTLSDPDARRRYDSKLGQPSSTQPQFTEFIFYDRGAKWDRNRLLGLREHISGVREQLTRLKELGARRDQSEEIGELQTAVGSPEWRRQRSEMDSQAEQLEQNLNRLNELSSVERQALINEARRLSDRAEKLIPEAIRFNIRAIRLELGQFERNIQDSGRLKKFFNALLHPSGHVGPSDLMRSRRDFEEVEKLFGDYPLVQLCNRLRTVRKDLRASQTAGRRPASEAANSHRSHHRPVRPEKRSPGYTA